MKKVIIFLGCACFLSLFVLQPAYAQWFGFSNPYDFGASNYGYPYSGFTQPNYGYSWNQPSSYGWGQPSYGWNQPSYGWNQPSYGWNQPSYGWNQPSYGWNQPSYGWNQPSYGWNQPSYGRDIYRDMYPSYYPDTYEYQNTYHWISDPIHGNQYVPIGYGSNQYVPIGYGNPYASAISVPGGRIVPGQGFVPGQGGAY